MTRILYWNIENFAIGKIFNNDTVNVGSSGQSLQAEANDRKNLILKQLEPRPDGTPGPDIFVVVEISVGEGKKKRGADFISAGAPIKEDGPCNLLASIRSSLVIANAAHWCLIPPLVLGGGDLKEAVAVFYNSTSLIFTGPNVFDGTKSIPMGPNATATNYPSTFYDATSGFSTLPLLTPLAAGCHASIPTANIQQNQLAGQYKFIDSVSSREIQIGNKIPVNKMTDCITKLASKGYAISPLPPIIDADESTLWGSGKHGQRPPFHVTFWDTANSREIKLFACHTSPSCAVSSVISFAMIDEIIDTSPTYSQVSVVLGDFNIDISRNSGAYGFCPLKGLGYHEGLGKPICTANPVPTSARYYLNTTIKGLDKDPLPYSLPYAGGNQDSYPGLQYLTENNYDNIFVRYSNNTGQVTPPVAGSNNTTIVNLITGTVYNAAAVQANYLTANSASPMALWPPLSGQDASGAPITRNVTWARRLVYASTDLVFGARDWGAGFSATPPTTPTSVVVGAGSINYKSTLNDEILPVCPTPPPPLLPKIANSMYWDGTTLNHQDPSKVQSQIDRQVQFQAWNFYGKIRSTSDHLPLVTDI